MPKSRSIQPKRTKAGGRQRGTPNKTKRELLDRITKICGDPLEGLAMIAAGDVVKLGYMTKRELECKAQIVKGIVVRPSGQEIALRYVPPDMRLKCFKELSEYCYAKRRAIVVEDQDGGPVIGGVMIYIPENNRGGPEVVKGVTAEEAQRLRREGRMTSAKKAGVKVKRKKPVAKKKKKS